jgi:hypothetical protein
MLIPFTAPRSSELDVLPPERRAKVLKDYAESEIARRLIRRTKAVLITAIVLGLTAAVVPDILDPAPSGVTFVKMITIGFWSATVLTVIIAIVFYRSTSRRAILSFLKSEDGKS